MRRASAALLLSVLLSSALTRAEPALPDAEVTRRLAFLEDVLAREQAATRAWYQSWLAIFGGATLAQGGLVAVAPNRAARVTGLVGGAKSVIAFTFLLSGPSTGTTAAAELATVPGDTPAARLVKLRHAEIRLRTIADEERYRQSWFPLIGGAVVNLAGAWITWTVTRSPIPGWIGIGAGTVVSQVQRLTQPTLALRAWASYARGRADARLPPIGPALTVAPLPGGMALQGSF